MTGSYDHQLICKILETGDMLTPLKFKMQPEWFSSPECQAAFRFLANHYKAPATYSTLPNWELFLHYFPSFPWCSSTASTTALCEHLRRLRARERLHLLAAEIQAKADTDPYEGIGSLREAASQMSGEFALSNDALMADSASKIKEKYYAIAGGAVTGIPFPWAYANEQTQGKYPGCYTFIFGRPAQKKSWLAMYMACYSYFVARKRVLFWSMELDLELCVSRCACILAGVDYERFKAGKLDPAVADQVFYNLETLRTFEAEGYSKGDPSKPAFLVTKPDSSESSTISALHAKIEEFGAQEVFVDGIYLMEDERNGKEWRKDANLSRDMKRLAGFTRVPITAVTQERKPKDKKTRSEASIDDMAFTDAFAQDGDISINIKSDNVTNESILTWVKTREAIVRPFVINSQLCTDFSFKRFHVVEEEESNDSGPKRAEKERSAQHASLPDWRKK